MATPLAVQVIVTAKDAATAVLNKFGSSVSKAAQSIKTQLGPALTGLATVGTAVTGMVLLSIKAFSTQEDAMARLRQGLINVGESLDNQGRSLLNQASALQKVTRFSDEEIISAQAMLTTFRLNTGQIEQLTPRILDMAEALRNTSGGTLNLEQASIMLGKAIGGEEMVGLVGALRRVGVVMTEHQKAIMETGNMQERLTVLTQIMDMNFKGFAEAGGKTFSGRLDIMKNQLSEVQEAVGEVMANALSPLVDKITNIYVPKLQDMVVALANNKAQTEGFSNALIVLSSVGVIASIVKLAGTLGLLNPYVWTITAIASAIAFLTPQIAELTTKQENWNMILENFRQAWQRIKDLFTRNTAWISRITALFDPMGAFAAAMGAAMAIPPGGGRQAGGYVGAGVPVTVGEGGPEVFVPSTGGMIEPRGGGGSPVTLNVNVGLYAGTETEKRRIAEMLYGQLVRLAAARKMTVEEAFGI